MVVGRVVIVGVVVWCAAAMFGIERGVIEMGGVLFNSGVMCIYMFRLYIVCV